MITGSRLAKSGIQALILPILIRNMLVSLIQSLPVEQLMSLTQGLVNQVLIACGMICDWTRVEMIGRKESSMMRRLV